MHRSPARKLSRVDLRRNRGSVWLLRDERVPLNKLAWVLLVAVASCSAQESRPHRERRTGSTPSKSSAGGSLGASGKPSEAGSNLEGGVPPGPAQGGSGWTGSAGGVEGAGAAGEAGQRQGEGGADAGESSPPLAPRGLICELLRHPESVSITDHRPEFGFVVESGLRGERLTAYQILVASSQEKLRSDIGDAWDSGKTSSSRTIDVEYDGVPLLPEATYFWKVRWWGTSGVASEWSTPQSFAMAADLDHYETAREPVAQTPMMPTRSVKKEDGTLFLDFGRDAFGWLELNVSVPQTVTVRVRLGERAAGDSVAPEPGGNIRYCEVDVELVAGARNHRVQTPRIRQNTTGAAIPLPESLGVVMPFRYVEILDAPVELDAGNVTRVTLHYPNDATESSFSSSDEVLNQVWELSKYSIVAPTFAGIYIDGDRERIPYEGDAYIQQLGHYSTDREFALARFSHEYLLQHPTEYTEWRQHSIMMAWSDWMYTGNIESLARAYDQLARERTLEDNIVQSGLVAGSRLEDLVDWPEGERDGHEFWPINTVVNAFFCHNLQLMAEMADALGKQSEGVHYRTLAARAVDALNTALFDTAQGVFVDGVGSSHSSLHSNMFPLAFGLVKKEHERSVVAFVKSRGMACSVYGAQYLLEALYRSGEADAALALLTADTDRSWVNMLRAGATITTEAWDAKYKPNLDWNHAWGAAPANIVARYLLGVRPLEPGFARSEIRPRLGNLRQAEGLVPTIRGAVRVKWDVDSPTGPRLSVELPVSMTANIAVPAQLAGCRISMDGSPAVLAEREGSTWIDGVESGAHELRCAD